MLAIQAPRPDTRAGGPASGRQHLYARSRQRDMAEVAHALKDTLQRTKANQKAFSDS